MKSISYSYLLKFACFLLLLIIASHSIGAYNLSIKGIQMDVKVVISDSDQSKGLSGYKKLNEREGMLFVYNKTGSLTLWMKGMLIPIDIIWIRKGQIVHIEKNVQPPKKVTTPDKELKVYGEGIIADTVLETQAGLSDKYNFIVGDRVTY